MLLTFAPDNQTLASVCETDAVRLWNAETGKQEKQLGEPGDVRALSLAFSPDGRFLAVGYRNDSMRIWDVKDGKVVHEQIKYTGKPDGRVSALAFAQDGKTLAASGSSTIALVDAAEGKVIRSFGPKDGALAPDVTALAFSPTGKIVASSAGALIQLWDTSGKELKTLEGHLNVVHGLAFTADGRYLASVSADHTVHLWETASGRIVSVWKGHRGPTRAVAVMPNGRTIVSGGDDTSLLLWDVTGRSPKGKLVHVNPQPGVLEKSWDALASLDPAVSNTALWNFVSGGKDAVDYIEKNIPMLDRKKIEQWIKDLDDDSFNVRNVADVELRKLGRLVEARLKSEVTKNTSVEVTRRIRGLLDKLPGGLTGEQINLRYRRVMTALEQDASPAARALLTKLIAGAPTEDGINLEAEAALTRLKKRGS
jgi:WD40 repeat protein